MTDIVKFRKYQRDYHHNLKQELFTILGWCCVKCGFSDVRALQFDHISGGGTKEMLSKFSNSPRRMYRYYVDHPEEAKQKLQVLCANCNWIKRFS